MFLSSSPPFFSSYFCNLTRSLLPTRSSQTSFGNVDGTTARVQTSLCLSKQEAVHLALFEEKSNSPKMYRLLLFITSVLIKFVLKPVSCKYVSLNDTSNAQNGVVPEPKNTCITYRMLQLKSVERNGSAAVQERKENVFLFHMRSQDDWKSFDKRKNIGGLLTCTYKGKRSLNRNRLFLQKQLDFRASLRKAINFHSKTSGMSALKWINLFEIPPTNKKSMYSVLVVNKDSLSEV